MKTEFTSKELAGLPGMPGTTRNVLAQAEREGWRRRLEKGVWVYHVESLPRETQEAVMGDGSLVTVEDPLTMPVVKMEGRGVENLKDWQREIMLARMAVLQEVENRVKKYGLNEALKAVAEMATEGMLPNPVQQAMTKALAKERSEGSGAAISVRTLQKWRAEARRGVVNLAPKPMDYGGIPAWSKEFMSRYKSPTQPTVTGVIREMQREGCKEVPTYTQARYWLKTRTGAVDRAKGRLSLGQVRSLMPYIKRDFSGLVPGQVIQGDGHSWYGLVAHPETGKAFVPEVTEMVDIATRMHLGFSVAFSESTEAVHDAIRSAIERVGIPMVLQWDRGSGAKNHAMHDEITGLAARLGFEVYHPTARNPQASGVIERLHQSVVIPAAKRLPEVFIGRRAKNEDLRRLVEAKIREGKVQLPTIADLVEVLELERREYALRPHRELPKIMDPLTGKRRHQSPLERMKFFEDEGWKPDLLPDAALLDEMRPEKVCSVMRGVVRLHSMVYASKELTEWHGNKVRVRYDIRDGSKVWVRTMGGQLICEAKRDGHVRPYLYDSALEKAVETRRQAKRRRLENRIGEIDAQGQRVIEVQPVALSEAEREAAARQFEGIGEGEAEVVKLPEPNPAARPIFRGVMAERDWGVWVQNNWDSALVDKEDRDEFRRRMESYDFRLLMGLDEDGRADVGEKRAG